MKTLVMLAMLATPAGLMAAGPTPAQQDMMQAMQKVQECMEQIDMSQLQQMETRSEQMGGEIDQLCAAGKRDKAQKLAMKFAKEIESLPVMVEMKKCSDMVTGTMPMMEGLGGMAEEEDGHGHICD